MPNRPEANARGFFVPASPGPVHTEPLMPTDDGALAPDREAQAARVLALIEGGSSERAACDEVGINRATFRAAALRLAAGDQYARACEALARDQVEKIEVVLQEARDGTITPEIARLELDARKWVASRLFRKTWGDKISAEHSGPDGSPLNVVINGSGGDADL